MNLLTSAYRDSGYIAFRWLACDGYRELAASKYRNALYEVRIRDTKHAGVRERYLVKLEGDARARAIRALIISGYSDDMRAPRWLAIELGQRWPRVNLRAKKVSAS